MGTRFGFLFILESLCLLGACEASAFAEEYPAMEAGHGHDPVLDLPSDQTYVGQGVPLSSPPQKSSGEDIDSIRLKNEIKALRARLAELESLPRAEPTKQQCVKTESTQFEWVPEKASDSIAKRLRIVGTLIRKHGRAYDYRAHTLAELLQILKRLESQ